jgi:hypothetical protein
MAKGKLFEYAVLYHPKRTNATSYLASQVVTQNR